MALAAAPFEAEVLRNGKYFGAAISGIQVEFGAPSADARGVGDSKEGPFCAETIRAKVIVCRYCGKDLPPP